MKISSSHLQFVNFVELHAYDASILDHNEGVCQLIFETHYDNLYTWGKISSYSYCT